MRVFVAVLALVMLPVLPASAAGEVSGLTCAHRAPVVQAGAGNGGGRLVAPGAVSVLLCRYRGLNPPGEAGTLARSRLVAGSAEVHALLTALDSLPASSAIFHCPMDDGSEIAATFTYPARSTELVVVGLTGCRTVTNGRLTRTAATGTGPQLISQLEALV